MARFRIAHAAAFCVLSLALSAGPGVLADDKAAIEEETKQFQGHWTLESSVTGGQDIPRDQLHGFVLIYEGDKHTLTYGDKVIQVGTQKIDPSKSPKAIDVTITGGPSKGKVMLGIYEIDGATLKVCFDPEGKERPTGFKSAPGSRNFVNVHKRVEK